MRAWARAIDKARWPTERWVQSGIGLGDRTCVLQGVMRPSAPEGVSSADWAPTVSFSTLSLESQSRPRYAVTSIVTDASEPK